MSEDKINKSLENDEDVLRQLHEYRNLLHP